MNQTLNASKKSFADRVVDVADVPPPPPGAEGQKARAVEEAIEEIVYRARTIVEECRRLTKHRVSVDREEIVRLQYLLVNAGHAVRTPPHLPRINQESIWLDAETPAPGERPEAG